MRHLALILTASLLWPVAATAQSVPVPASPVTAPLPAIGAPAVSLHQWQMDQHRAEIDRLRYQAEQRQAFAAELDLQARQTVLQLQSQRDPGLPVTHTTPALTPSAARPLNRAVVAGVTQIDAWLDRPTAD